MTDMMMTPREYSASLRGLPFRIFKRPDIKQATWEAVGGLVAAAAPGKEHYVQYCDLYCVVWDEDFGYTIASYWVESKYDWLHRPYTMKTLRKYFHTGKLIEIERGITYEELMEHIKSRYPRITIPSKQAFFAQFGVPLAEVE